MKQYLPSPTRLAFFGAVFLTASLPWLFPRAPQPFRAEEVNTGTCVGEMLEIPHAYHGGPVDPWSCQIQCEDNVQRYLMYTNGIATQCQLLPGCLDEGEDNGVTCTPPLQSQEA